VVTLITRVLYKIISKNLRGKENGLEIVKSIKHGKISQEQG
jgi:hypothetical protein